MKAVQINTYGGNEVLNVNLNVPAPTVKEGQVLVEVHAASINPFDMAVRSGMLKNALQLPIIMGGDFAGVVMEVGRGVGQFKKGDEVYGSAQILGGGSGAFAEMLTANIANTALKPKSANFDEAGALPLVGTSAIQALEDHMKLQRGQKILIHGGAGGIGHVAIQLGKAIGAYVATTVSVDDMEFVKSLGADEVIDYKKQKFEEILKEYDAVFDTVGGETTNQSFKVLKKGGVLVSMRGQPNPELAEKYTVIAIGQATKTTTERLDRLTTHVDRGEIKVHIAQVFQLAQVQEAFALLESHPQGKVVLKVKE